MSKFVRKEIRYRHGAVTDPLTSAAHIHNDTVAVGQTYHLESDAQFKRDLEQSLSDIVTRRLQEAEDEAIGLVKIAEETAEKNARQIADDILAKANAQAKEMVEVAQSQVESIKEAAHEAGFKTGFQEGYSDATAQVEQETVELLKGVHRLTEKAYQTEKLVLKNFEKNAVDLITHVTRKVLNRELTDDPETLLNLVQQAVDSLYISGKVKVVVNPQVLQDIREFSTVTEQALQQMSRFEFIADPALELTQLFIIGEEGCFDLSPQTQIVQLLAPLHDALVLPRPERNELASPTDEAGISTSETERLAQPEASPAQASLSFEPVTETAAVATSEAAEPPEQPIAELAPSMPAAETQIPTFKATEPRATEIQPEAIALETEPEAESVAEVKPYLFESFDDMASADASGEDTP